MDLAGGAGLLQHVGLKCWDKLQLKGSAELMAEAGLILDGGLFQFIFNVMSVFGTLFCLKAFSLRITEATLPEDFMVPQILNAYLFDTMLVAWGTGGMRAGLSLLPLLHTKLPSQSLLCASCHSDVLCHSDEPVAL